MKGVVKRFRDRGRGETRARNVNWTVFEAMNAVLSGGLIGPETHN